MNRIDKLTIADYVRSGNQLHSQGRGEEAIEYYKKALLISPNHSVVLLNMGAGLYSLGRLDEAETILKKALEKPFDRVCTSYCHYNLGMVYLGKRELSKAIISLGE
jgi:tetratricopeptide (TPR) repeat protein